MVLSKCGRVVIIDDKLEDEARPLMNALGKNEIPYLYFDGSEPMLPPSPLEGIRIVFLDIQLAGAPVTGDRDATMASNAVGILSRIISENNGPFVIVFWSKHGEVISRVVRNCETRGIAPVKYLSIEKHECKDGNGDFDINIISQKLEDSLSDVGAFALYNTWENILGDSCTQFVREFASLVQPGSDWSKQTAELFFALYSAYVGGNELPDNLDRFKCACHLMNRSFLDVMENNTNTKMTVPNGFSLEVGTITESTKAKLNTWLNLCERLVHRQSTGDVYNVTDPKLLEGISNKRFGGGNKPDNMKLVAAIITPECDLAYKKTVQIKISEAGAEDNHSRLQRVLYGLLYPIRENVSEEIGMIKGGEWRFIIAPLWLEEKSYMLVMDLSMIAFSGDHEFGDNPQFSLRRDILSDLQSKAANYANRIGNIQVQ